MGAPICTWGPLLLDLSLSPSDQVVHVDAGPVDGEEFPMAAELPQPHHDGENVSVVVHQRSFPHVAKDHLTPLQKNIHEIQVQVPLYNSP